jgi:hypothetical protein
MINPKKASTIFTIIGISFFILSYLYFNTGEFKTVQDLSDSFLDSIRSNEYLDAFQFVDSFRIKIDDFKKITALIATHYKSCGTIFFKSDTFDTGNKLIESRYITGFKPNSIDNDKLNDYEIEFWIEKINGKWKIVKIINQ